MKKLPLQNPEYKRLLHEYAEWLALLGYADSTVYNLPHHVKEFLYYLESEGKNQIGQVGRKEVKAFFNHLAIRDNQRRAGSLSGSYLNKYLQALKNFSRYLTETHQGQFSLSKRTIRTDQQVKTILTPGEIRLLYQVCDNSILGIRDKAMLSVFYGCGLRRNEGVQLDTDDLLFSKGLLYVRKGKNYTERYVHMSEKVMADLKGYLEVRGQLTTKHSGKAFFISMKANRTDGQSLLIRLKKLQQGSQDEKLIEKQIGLHTLRHSIATHLLWSGMKLRYIAKFLGHQSLESTQIYTQLKKQLK
jgi:integrase/recombinase XerD